MKFYYRIGSRNGISIENTYKKSHYSALCAIEGHFPNFEFSVAAILDKLDLHNFLIIIESGSLSYWILHTKIYKCGKSYALIIF